MHIEIDGTKCKKDQLCIIECPFNCLDKDDIGVPYLLDEREQFCIGCGHCVAICPTSAVTLNGVNPESLRKTDSRTEVSPQALRSLLDNRRSVRVFRKQKVERKLVMDLLSMVKRAPTAKNLQPVSWLVIDDEEKIHILAGLVIDWLRTLGDAQAAVVAAWDAGEDIIMRNAPLLMMACANEEALKPVEDCSIAVTSLELAAASYGLGSFWLGYFMTASKHYLPIREFLELGDKMLPFAALGIGWPKMIYHRLPQRKEPEIRWL